MPDARDVETARAQDPAFLAAGLAHDLCNLLSSALTNIELARLRHPDLAELAQASDACMHAGELARRLRGGAAWVDHQRLSLHGLLNDALALMRHRLDERHVVVSAHGAGHDAVLGDGPALLSALVNLILNACEAMPQGGQLSLETGLGQGGNGAEIWVSISDTGAGIPEEMRDRLFEPYASSKSQHPNRGLGMAMVAHTLRQHGGRIEVGPARPLGTRVRLTLPAAQ